MWEEYYSLYNNPDTLDSIINTTLNKIKENTTASIKLKLEELKNLDKSIKQKIEELNTLTTTL